MSSNIQTNQKQLEQQQSQQQNKIQNIQQENEVFDQNTNNYNINQNQDKFQFSFAPQKNNDQYRSESKTDQSKILNKTNQQSFYSGSNNDESSHRQVKTQPSDKIEEDDIQLLVQKQIEYFKKKKLNLAECTLKQIEQCNKNSIFNSQGNMIQKKIYNQQLSNKIYENLEQSTRRNKKKLTYDVLDAAQIYSNVNTINKSMSLSKKKNSQSNIALSNNNKLNISITSQSNQQIQTESYKKEQDYVLQKIKSQQQEQRLVRKQSNQTQSVHSMSYERKLKPLFDRSSSKDNTVIEHTSYYIWHGAIHRRVSTSANPYLNKGLQSNQKENRKFSKNNNQHIQITDSASNNNQLNSTKSTQFIKNQINNNIKTEFSEDTSQFSPISNNFKLPRISQNNNQLNSSKSIRSFSQMRNNSSNKQQQKTLINNKIIIRQTKSLEKQSNKNQSAKIPKYQQKKINQIVEENNDFQDISLTITRNNKENFILISIKYGFQKELKILNTNISLHRPQNSLNPNSSSGNPNSDLNWNFDEIWYNKKDSKQLQQLQQQNLSQQQSYSQQQLHDMYFVKGKNENMKINTLLQIIPCSLENTYTMNELQQHLKDIAITHFLNKSYERQKEHNPGPIILSPASFLQRECENQFNLVWEQEYQSSLESILEYRYTISKNWEELELLNNFYQILSAMNELSKHSLCHGNLTPDAIVYSYLTQRYKLINFSYVQAYQYRQNFNINNNGNNMKKINYFYHSTPPFVAPEMKFKYQFEQKTKHAYDPAASDMYSLGVCFLFMKYITPQAKRGGDCVQVRIASLLQDKSLSSQIIQKLVNPQPVQRVLHSYEDLCTEIRAYLLQQNGFKQWQIQIGTQIRLLNPKDKFKFLYSREPEDIANSYYATFQWAKAFEKYRWVLDGLQHEARISDPIIQQQQQQISQGIQNLHQDQQNQQLKQSQQIQPENFKTTKAQTQQLENSKNSPQPNQKQQQQDNEKQSSSLQQQGELLLVLNRMWRCLYRIGKLDEAFQRNQQYFKLVTDLKVSASLNLAADYHESGKMKWQANQHESALQDFEMSLNYMKQLANTKDSASMQMEILQNLNNIGVLYWQSKQYEKSQRAFMEVIQKLKKNRQMQQQQLQNENLQHEDDLYLAVIDNLSSVHRDQQQFDAAIALMQEQYKIRSEREGEGHINAVTTLGKIGMLYFQLSDFQNSKKYLQIAIKKRQMISLPDDQTIIKWRQTYANVLFKLGEKDPAMQILNATLNDLKNNFTKSMNQDPTHILINIADFVQDTGNTQESLKFYSEALKLAKMNLGAQNDLIKNLSDKVVQLEKTDKIQENTKNNDKNNQKNQFYQ